MDTGEVQQLRNEIARLNAEVERVREQELYNREILTERFARQLANLRNEIETPLLLRLRSLQRQSDELAASLSYYKSEYEKAITSRSWQITKPLRTATQFLGQRRTQPR